MQVLAAVNFLFLSLIAFWIWKRDTDVLHKFYWPALIAKCVAGLSMGIIYSTYYDTSDTFTFFRMASDQADLARNNVSAYFHFLFSEQEGYYLGEHRTIFFTKIISVLALLTGNNYWVASLYLSLVAFYSAWYLSNTLARLFPDYKMAACVAFLFFPSVVFWSSGIIKESLAMAAMFFLSALFLKLWMKERIHTGFMALAIVCGITVFNLKYYYLAAFIPVTVSALATRWLSAKLGFEKPLAQGLIFAGVLACGFLAIIFLHPNFYPSRVLEIIVLNNRLFMEACTPDDVIHFYNLEPTGLSLLINAPWALISGLFRPFVWEANTVFKLITGIENLVVLGLAIFTIPHLRKLKFSPHRLLTVACLVFCAVLSIFLALSTPNFGTLARYGVGYLPFVVLLTFYHPWVTKIFSRFF